MRITSVLHTKAIFMNTRNCCLLVCVAVLLAALPSAILAQSYIVIDVPGANATHPVSINNRGDVAGYFCPGVSYCDQTTLRGFVRSNSNGDITVFEGVPQSINDGGTVAGYFYDSAGFHNFSRDHNGNVTVFDLPQLPAVPAAGFSVAINNRGDIAGVIVSAFYDTSVGFVRDKQGDLSTFTIDRGLVPTAINASGEVTGHTSDFFPASSGFVRDRKGVITIFDVPGSSGLGPHAYSVSINNRGDVVGYFFHAFSYGGQVRGFLRDFTGNITVIDAAPNANTMVTCINEGGDMAGDFQDATGAPLGNFIRNQSGEITVFNVGHIVAINNRSDVTGYNGVHGFLLTKE